MFVDDLLFPGSRTTHKSILVFILHFVLDLRKWTFISTTKTFTLVRYEFSYVIYPEFKNSRYPSPSHVNLCFNENRVKSCLNDVIFSIEKNLNSRGLS